jgi:hypothetical protein
VKITELNGVSLVLTQTDGKTFRILARETQDIEESLISEEFRIAQKRGYIFISEEPKPTTLKPKIITKTKTTEEGGNE